MHPLHPVAVVTGSSSGIGQAIAVEFAKAGYHVFVHCNRNQSGLAKTKQLIRDQSAKTQATLDNASNFADCESCSADLSNDDGIQKLFDAAASWKNRIDAWVNCAGVDVLTGNAKHWSFETKLDALWSVDVRAAIQLSRLAADLMRAQPRSERRPTILNISWDQANQGMEGDSGQFFSATKAAIAAFTKSFANTVGPHVRANCIAPGWILTSWGQDAPTEWRERAIGESALGRWGQPEDIASVAVWLASAQAEFINGQVIAVNGGWKPHR